MNSNDKNSLPILLRQMRESDLNFIVHSWVNKTRYLKENNEIDHTSFFSFQRSLIKKILPMSETIVICNKDEPDHIFGFCVYRKLADYPVLSMLYVKDAYRNLGLENLLVESILKPVTIMTTNMFWLKNIFPKIHFQYNPFLDLVI